MAMASTVTTSASWLASALHDRWVSVRDGEDRFPLAVAVALLLHVLPLVVMTGGWWGLGQASEVGAGDPAGVKEGINVEVIDAAEYDRRYISFGKGRAAADSQPARTAMAEPTAPQRPAEPQDKPAPEPSSLPPARELPAAPGPSPSPKFTEADIAEILLNAQQDFQNAVVSTSAASQARLGQASAYVRSVLRQLKQTMPKAPGMRGAVTIGLILTETGSIGWIGVLKSSGRPELDRFVIERVRSTRFDPPTKDSPPHERRFQITYEYH